MAGLLVRRTSDGAFELRIPADDRDALRSLPGQLRALLLDAGADDPGLRRLFPSADPDDAEHAAEFDRLVRDDLVAQRIEAADTMERTIDAERVDEDALLAWLGVANDLRLVLGARLGVTEGSTERDFADDDRKASAFVLFSYLGWLESQIVDALSGT